MSEDIWSRWLLERRFPADAAAAERLRRDLFRLREGVLDGAHIEPGDVVLDVGAGDGLIAFGALERTGLAGRVIFSDISAPLLDHSSALAREFGVADRCSFVLDSADQLALVEDSSVDVVTLRSVLIYVKDKDVCFRQFHRVLRPGGRLSLFEPINRAMQEFQPDCYWGGGIPEIADLAERLRDHYSRLQPPDSDPMLDFDERDLVRQCVAAGFESVHLRLEVDVAPRRPSSWETATSAAGNPNIPSLREALSLLFTTAESERFERFARPAFEAGGQPALSSAAWLRARKASAAP